MKKSGGQLVITPFKPPAQAHAQQPGRMAKKDMSFMKMVASDEDFQREVYEHGQDNLLVGAPPPSASLFCVCLC